MLLFEVIQSGSTGRMVGRSAIKVRTSNSPTRVAIGQPCMPMSGETLAALDPARAVQGVGSGLSGNVGMPFEPCRCLMMAARKPSVFD